ncbi:hypothetical protein DVH24_026062 [Malus domestica]|uniref:Uncharacterized protein n=1 Tax=Malus domestica TaxID=3750 RepID=A0A498KHQ2_MALDO|nr:hypothetical protein DVH24_026062 [Malus domestica]
MGGRFCLSIFPLFCLLLPSLYSRLTLLLTEMPLVFLTVCLTHWPFFWLMDLPLGFFMVYDWFQWLLQGQGGGLRLVLVVPAGRRWELTGPRVVFFLGFILLRFLFLSFLILVPSSLSLSVCFSFCSPLSASLLRTFMFWSSQPRFSHFIAASFSGQLCARIDMYQSMGDALAQQYGGSAAHYTMSTEKENKSHYRPIPFYSLLDNNNNLSGYLLPEFSELPSLLMLYVFLLWNINLCLNYFFILSFLEWEQFSRLSFSTNAIPQVDNNNFGGTTIPDSYSNMSKLFKLRLRNCNLQGPIPDFSRIPNLGYA